MSDVEKKSVTIRLEGEPELSKWISNQVAPISSIKAAVKMCMYQYGTEKDLLDAIIYKQFGKDAIKDAAPKLQNFDIVEKVDEIPNHNMQSNSDNNAGNNSGMSATMSSLL